MFNKGVYNVRKAATLFIAVLLAFVFLLAGCSGTQNPDSGEYTLARGENEKQVTFYYNRSSGIYDNCDIWLWYDGADGQGYIFHECAYGAKVVVNVPDTVTEVGFIVRTGCSDPGGTSWGEATKDGTQEDRFASLTGTETVYYLKGGDANLYTSDDGGVTLNELKNVEAGDLVDTKTVRFTLSSRQKVTADMVSVRDADGKALDISGVESNGGIYGTVTLVNELDITKTYTVGVEGFDGRATIVPITYFSSNDFNNKYYYDGDDLGVTLASDSTTFKLWAPTASAVVLNLFDNGSTGAATSKITLTKGEKGVWSHVAASNLAGKYYTYTVTTSEGAQEAVDPYARSAGLNGKRGMILDLDSTDPEGWTSSPFVNEDIENYTDAVIWEVQVRDFSNKITDSKYKGKYLAFTETGLKNSSGQSVGIDYLKDLGITHVHLMPSYDFGSVDESSSTGYNWGYDPQNYNVPEGSYSTDPSDGAVRVNEFKQMVQALHNAGISVVMDVVYNHTYSIDSNLNKVVPYYYYRYQSNGTASNGSGCGNETASERKMYRKYMVDSVTYWMEEYNVDGFRFDLMGLHDVETMQEIEKAVHGINSQALIYGEGWTGGTSTLSDNQKSTLSNIKEVNTDSDGNGITNGIAMFNDVLRDAIKGSTNGTDTGYATGAVASNSSKIKFGVTGGGSSSFSTYSAGWSAYNPTNVINYASAHDNLALWDKICAAYGEADATLEARTKRNALSAAIVFTSLGIPFMQAGEEMLRSKKNADGTYNENSYNAGDEVNNLKWDLLTSDSAQYKMSRYYKGLIEFRKSSPALRSATSKDSDGNSIVTLVAEDGAFLAFTITYGGETVLVVYNATEAAKTLTLPTGSWDLYINGSSAGATAIESGLSGDDSIDGISCYVYRKIQSV